MAILLHIVNHSIPCFNRYSTKFFPFQNNLGPSYETDLDFSDYFRKVKTFLMVEFHNTDINIYGPF